MAPALWVPSGRAPSLPWALAGLSIHRISDVHGDLETPGSLGPRNVCISQIPCIRFLWLLYQISLNLVAQNNTFLLSYSSIGQKPDIGLTGLKSRCWQDCIPSADSRGESTYLPSPASRGCSLAHGPSSTFKAGNKELSPYVASLQPPLLPLSSKDLCDYIGPTWMIEETLSLV